jgi:hypothetical protein
MLIVSLFFVTHTFGQIAVRGPIPTPTNTTTGTTLTLTKPTGLAIGDIMFANIMQNDNDGGSLSNAQATDLSWTVITGRDIGGTGTNELWGTLLYKVATAADAASTTTSFSFNLDSEADDGIGGIVAFSGVDLTGGVTEAGAPGGPFDIDPQAYNVTTSDDLSAPSITTASSNAAVVMFGMNADNESYSLWTTTSPGSLAELFDLTFDATIDMSVGAAWALKPTAGGTGTGIGTAEISDADNEANGAILIALKPCTATTAAPVITTTTICAGATSISGTSSEADGTIIEVFRGGASLGTTTVSSGGWTKTGISPALAGEML